VLLGFFLLGPNEQEIEDDNHQDHGNNEFHWAALRLTLREQNQLCGVVAHFGSQQKGGNHSDRQFECKRLLGFSTFFNSLLALLKR
jgi:hypothetical protein